MNFTHKETFDLDQPLPPSAKGLSWERKLAGIRITRLLQDASSAKPATADVPVRQVQGPIRRLRNRLPEHNPGMKGILIVVPHAYVAAAFATIAVFELLKFRRRPQPGHCPACGYDLRASTDLCPECGTPMAGTWATA